MSMWLIIKSPVGRGSNKHGGGFVDTAGNYESSTVVVERRIVFKFKLARDQCKHNPI